MKRKRTRQRAGPPGGSAQRGQLEPGEDINPTTNPEVKRSVQSGRQVDRPGRGRLPGPAAESRGVRSGRPAGRAAGRPGRAPATSRARRQRAGPAGWSTRPAGEEGESARATPTPACRPPSPRRPGRDRGTGHTRGRARRRRLARAAGPPAPRVPPGRGDRGAALRRPRTPVRATPLPPSPGPARGRGPAAGKRRKGRGTPRPGGAARGGPPPLLSSHVGPRPLRGGRRSPPAPDRGPGPRTRRRPPAERRSPRGGKRERESERPRPGRSDKPLCRGLTFNRSQRGSCSATYETPTQKQVVYEWFSTRCPTNVRCVTGEGAAAFPAAPRVPGRRALRTGPRSRRAAGARRAAAPAGGGTRATARRRGRRGTGYPRPTEAPAALPYRSAWAGF